MLVAAKKYSQKACKDGQLSDNGVSKVSSDIQIAFYNIAFWLLFLRAQFENVIM